MPDTGVTITVKTRGTQRAAAETHQVAKGVSAIGGATGIAVKGLSNLRTSMNLGATAGYALRRSTYVVGAGLVGLGTLSIRAGLQFNASMESNSIAFTQFLGSAKAARQEMGTLFTLAAHTPFELTNVTKAERQLLAFGFSVKSSNSWLQTIGDTISGMGGGPQEIDQLVRAIGQIRSKGRLQGDELMQLSELGVVNRGRLAKDLGISALELQSGNADIPATKALAALKKQFDDTFGGQSAKQAKTFNGQWSTLHDNISQTLGTLTGPLFKNLESDVFPALNSTAERLNQIWSMDATSSQKFALSRTAIKHRLGPIESAIEHEIKDLHLGDKLTEEFSKAVPKLADAAARAAPKIAAALGKGFLDSGPYGQLFIALVLAKKTGAIGGLGGLLLNQMKDAGRRGGAGTALGKIGGAPIPVYVVNWGKTPGTPTGGLPGKGKTAKALRIGKSVLPALGPVGLAVGAGIAGAELVGPAPTPAGQRVRRTPMRAGRGGPTFPVNQGGRAHARPGGSPFPDVIINLDGKTIAKVTHRNGADAKARR